MIITSLERQLRRRQRVNLFVDGQFAALAGPQPRPGEGPPRRHDRRRGGARGAARRGRTPHRLRRRHQPPLLSPAQREARCDSACAVAASRPKSSTRPSSACAPSHYLDDAAFAQFWRESRETLSPRSGRLIRSELLFKGVDADTATATVEGLDDEEAAYRAAAKRLKSLQGDDYDVFRRRLGGFLTRRGFSYDVVRRVLERCWRELGGDEPALIRPCSTPRRRPFAGLPTAPFFLDRGYVAAYH